MMRSFLIIQLGSKSDAKCPYRRHTEERNWEERIRPCDDGDRDCSDAATYQGHLGPPRGKEEFSPRASGGAAALPAPWFWAGGLQN